MSAVLQIKPVPASDLMRFGFSGARARVWRQPAIQRLTAPDADRADYAAVGKRLLLAYRRIEQVLGESERPAGALPFASRARLLEQDLADLGHEVGAASPWTWPGPRGPFALVGLQCAVLDLECGSETVARNLWRQQPSLWQHNARYWQFISHHADEAQGHFREADELLCSSPGLHAATRAGIAALEVFYAYVSA